MNLMVVGISHKTSSIDIREKFYLTVPERELLLTELRCEPLIAEALVISTCNRTEIYAFMVEGDDNLLFRKLCALKKQSFPPQDASCFYTYYREDAVRHLLNVSAGLDSLVLGEKEILGQVKQAVDLSREKVMLGRFMNLLSNIAIRAGKLARSQTAINCGGSSVSWAAVEMAKKTLGTLQGKSVLIIGAGKMSQLAAGDFQRKGVERLFIMNRTKAKGEELARKFNGQAVGFLDIREILSHVDVCICSAGATHYLLEKELVDEVMRTRQKELVLIDISMPRNIDPGVSGLDRVRLLSLDELDRAVADNADERCRAVGAVLDIVDRKMEEFYSKLKACSQKDRPGAFVSAGG